MILNEDEARKCWCPIVTDSPHCFASRCMFWRWHNIHTKDGYCGAAGKPETQQIGENIDA